MNTNKIRAIGVIRGLFFLFHHESAFDKPIILRRKTKIRSLIKFVVEPLLIITEIIGINPIVVICLMYSCGY